mgnify:CR=1 FL=1
MPNSISTELQAHYAGRKTTLATCCKFTLKSTEVRGFTSHDRPITFGGVTYLASTGYNRSNVETSDALDVDNLQLLGVMVDPSITEADLAAGVWDYARVEIFEVNWADLTMGERKQRTGRLGRVTLKRGQFVAELKGLMEAYARSVGEVTSPTCRATFGDSRCKKSLTSYTVTGALTGVNADNQTLYDTSRTEPGPTGEVNVTNVTNANPGIVTIDDPGDFRKGDAVTISGVEGPALVNGVTVFRGDTGATTFSLGIDTSDTSVYPAYTGGGTVTPFGGTQGAFDYGLITFTSGENAGLSMEIKSYVPGQFVLQLPMPYPCVEGDEYTAIRGCNKAFATCRDTYDNVLNFQGEPHIQGTDKLIQVGQQT